MPCLGDVLLEFLSGAQHRVVLVSPFIKKTALTRALGAIPSGVPVEVFTRWRADEIASGVSDLSIWDDLCQRPGASLRLCDRLHAKAYVVDREALVGSANLTATALGWASRPNLELLTKLPAQSAEVVRLQEILSNESIEATEDLRDLMAELAEALLPSPRVGAREAADGPVPHVSPGIWIPSLRSPELLFDAYNGCQDTLTSASRESARADLLFLDIPAGLTHDQFRLFVASVLLQQPLISRLDALLGTPRRFGEIVTWLRSEHTESRP